MSFSDLRHRFRSLFQRAAVERELAAELAHHASVRGRLPEADAVAEACRDARGISPVENLARDLRWAGRSLRHAPGFAIPALLTLALGLGAATAMFSVADAVLVQPLAYPGASRLVLLRERLPLVAPDPIQVSGPDIALLRAAGPAFSAMAGFDSGQADLTGAGATDRLRISHIGSALLPMIGGAPALGRGFTTADDQPGHNVVLLGDGLWHSRFGADPGVVGRAIHLDGKAYTVVGVMPPGFEFPPRGLLRQKPAQLWLPLQFTPAQLADVADNFDYGVLARLKPGATLASARAQMAAAAIQVQASWTAKVGRVPGLKLFVVVDPLRDLVVAGARTLMTLLLGAAGLLLVLSCANTANLFLVRASSRRREWALRAALGAGRGRILRQALTESGLLSLAAGALGVGFAWICLRGLTAAAPDTLPQVQGIGLNLPVLAFAGLLALLVGPLCGALSARAAAAGDIEPTLRESAPSLSGGRRDARWRSTLVAAQVALAFVLVCGAALLVRSFRAALDGGAGVVSAGRTVAALSLPATAYPTPSRIAAWAGRLRAALAAQPGVESVALATDQPTNANWSRVFSVESRPQPPGAKLPQAGHALVLGPYFRTVGIPVLRGRGFSADEAQGKAAVVIVSANLAARYWPGRSALGERIKWGTADSSSPWLTVVGVVGNVKDTGLDQPAGMVTYSPYRMECQDAVPFDTCRNLYLTVRSRLAPAAAAAAIRRAVAGLDPDVPVTKVQSLDALLASSLAPRRFNTVLIAFFGLAALLLAAVGLYGVLAFVVSGQRREIALRMALGARPSGVLGATLRLGLRWSLLGLGLGALAAAGAAGTIRSLLYRTPALDPLTWAAVALLLLATALLACVAPARRAARTDPQSVLREG